jgi:hypothetical protein
LRLSGYNSPEILFVGKNRRSSGVAFETITTFVYLLCLQLNEFRRRSKPLWKRWVECFHDPSHAGGSGASLARLASACLDPAVLATSRPAIPLSNQPSLHPKSASVSTSTSSIAALLFSIDSIYYASILKTYSIKPPHLPIPSISLFIHRTVAPQQHLRPSHQLHMSR